MIFSTLFNKACNHFSNDNFLYENYVFQLDGTLMVVLKYSKYG